MARKTKANSAQLAGLLGVGFDADDGHKRITKGEEFLLVGGSAETHERLQDVAIHVTESLKNKGKSLRDAEIAEVVDLMYDAMER